MASLNERLMKAAADGKVDEIAALLDQGADIDFAPPPYQVTPLIQAINWKQRAAALYLINRGANVRLADIDGTTALYLACRNGWEAVARELLKRGADIEAKGWNGCRPLHEAVETGHESIVRLLVTEHGAQINARDGDDLTPLLLALERRHEGVASFLIAAGADASISNTTGRTALHYACFGGLNRIVTRLLDEFDLDLHAKTSLGHSCLSLAAFDGHVETCRFLLEHGLSVDNLDIHGRSPLISACGFGHASVAELLLDHGADIEHKDDRGRTALSDTIMFGPNKEQVALLLIQHGAQLDGSLPEDFDFASIDEGLTEVLEHGFLETLFTEPDSPIPPYRRVLRWALTSPAVAALVQKNGWSLLGTAKTEDEVEEMIKKRLALVGDDAWKRRMHLVIDRALDWGYGDSSKAPPAKQEEKKEAPPQPCLPFGPQPAAALAVFVAKGSRGDVQPLLCAALAFLEHSSLTGSGSSSVLFFTHREHAGSSWLDGILKGFSASSSSRIQIKHLTTHALATSNHKGGEEAGLLEDVKAVATATKVALAKAGHAEVLFAFNLFALETLFVRKAFPAAHAAALSPYFMPPPPEAIKTAVDGFLRTSDDASAAARFNCNCRDEAAASVCSLHHWLYPLLGERFDSVRRWLSVSSRSLVDDLVQWSTQVPLLYGVSERAFKSLALPSTAKLTGFWRLYDRAAETAARPVALSLASVEKRRRPVFLVTLGSLPCFGLFGSSGDGDDDADREGSARSVVAFLVGLAVCARDACKDAAVCLVTSGFDGYVKALGSPLLNPGGAADAARLIPVVSNEEDLAAALSSSRSDSTSHPLLRLLSSHLIVYDGSPSFDPCFFARCGAVGAIHHGGSGTTAACLFAGVPQVILPLMMDQFDWQARCTDAECLGVSPSPAGKKEAAKQGASEEKQLDLEDFLDGCREYLTALTDLRPTLRLIDQAAVKRAIGGTLSEKMAKMTKGSGSSDGEGGGATAATSGSSAAGSDQDGSPLFLLTRDMRTVITDSAVPGGGPLATRCRELAALLEGDEAAGKAGASFAAELLGSSISRESGSTDSASPFHVGSVEADAADAEEAHEKLSALARAIVRCQGGSEDEEAEEAEHCKKWSLHRVTTLDFVQSESGTRTIKFAGDGLLTGGLDETAFIAKEVMLRRDYDALFAGKEVNWLLTDAAPPSPRPLVVLDAGANVGLFCLHFIRLLKKAIKARAQAFGDAALLLLPQVTLIAIEPVAFTCALLIRNVETELGVKAVMTREATGSGEGGAGRAELPVAILTSSELNLSVRVHRAALTDDAKKHNSLAIQAFPRLSGNSTAKPLQKLAQRRRFEANGQGHLFENAFTTVVATTTVADLLRCFSPANEASCSAGSLSPPSPPPQPQPQPQPQPLLLLKIDVEGCELEVLKGATACRGLIEGLAAEVHDFKGKRLAEVVRVLCDGNGAGIDSCSGFRFADVAVRKAGLSAGAVSADDDDADEGTFLVFATLSS